VAPLVPASALSAVPPPAPLNPPGLLPASARELEPEALEPEAPELEAPELEALEPEAPEPEESALAAGRPGSLSEQALGDKAKAAPPTAHTE